MDDLIKAFVESLDVKDREIAEEITQAWYEGFKDRDNMIVRCKECHRNENIGCPEGYGWCAFHRSIIIDEDYCSYGERINDE